MILKVEGPGSIRSSQPVRRTSKSGSTSASFAKQLDETSEASAVGGASGVGAAGMVSGVIGVQEVDDATERASRGKLRAENILEQLDELRLDLLAGAIPREKLLNMMKMVNARRLEVTDPRLGQILDEIDLRAQVELAKYSHAKEHQ
ncbi:MAG: flagellar assembly protein FliX [Alphaproteobacteria bacterium]|nr:flagellar assembly protein FliX [Alphaproteobacteria bacterium]